MRARAERLRLLTFAPGLFEPATGADTTGGLDVWLRVAWRLASGRSPADAWGTDATQLPATWWYWTCTATALAALAALAAAAVWLWRRPLMCLVGWAMWSIS